MIFSRVFLALSLLLSFVHCKARSSSGLKEDNYAYNPKQDYKEYKFSEELIRRIIEDRLEELKAQPYENSDKDEILKHLKRLAAEDLWSLEPIFRLLARIDNLKKLLDTLDDKNPAFEDGKVRAEIAKTEKNPIAQYIRLVWYPETLPPDPKKKEEIQKKLAELEDKLNKLIKVYEDLNKENQEKGDEGKKKPFIPEFMERLKQLEHILPEKKHNMEQFRKQMSDFSRKGGFIEQRESVFDAVEMARQLAPILQKGHQTKRKGSQITTRVIEKPAGREPKEIPNLEAEIDDLLYEIMSLKEKAQKKITVEELLAKFAQIAAAAKVQLAHDNEAGQNARYLIAQIPPKAREAAVEMMESMQPAMIPDARQRKAFHGLYFGFRNFEYRAVTDDGVTNPAPFDIKLPVLAPKGDKPHFAPTPFSDGFFTPMVTVENQSGEDGKPSDKPDPNDPSNWPQPRWF